MAQAPVVAHQLMKLYEDRRPHKTAVLSVTSSSAFAETIVGNDSPVVTYTYTNTGSADAVITRRRLRCTQFAGGNLRERRQYHSGASCTYGVVFQPASIGLITDTWCCL